MDFSNVAEYKHIVRGPATQRVLALAAIQPVRATATEQPVFAVAALQPVAARAAPKLVLRPPAR